MDTKVRVRSAPSPTGTPHIGYARSAVFNWLFARANNGKFILRIEDTDQARLVPGSVEEIEAIHQWLGINPDESSSLGGDFGPYTQSQRKDIYSKYAKELTGKGFLYSKDGALFFKVKTEKGETGWNDLVHGQIAFQNDSFGDFVAIKSDGFPTYHFANVIDDHLMEISHTLRGDEWISSTPKHLQIYEALGWKPPLIGHLPLIVGSDKTKLSKRHGAKSALEYRDEGYLPEAVFNFLALLGWSPKSDQEIFTKEELINAFNIEGINPTMPVFNQDKLNWYNGQYIRSLNNDDLARKILDGGFADKKIPMEKITQIIPLVKERMVTLKDFERYSDFFLAPFNPNTPDLIGKNDKAFVIQVLNDALKIIDKTANFDHDSLERSFRDYVESINSKAGTVFMILRIAVTGSTTTPPLFETMTVIGKEECCQRITQSISQLQ